MKHGMCKTRTYRIWSGMLTRCRNANNHAFANYGELGIAVCERWLEFKNFLADMGEAPDGLSIERVDNSAGYSPQNCKWATREEQANNKRNNSLICMNGVSKSVSQWARELGVYPTLITARLRVGWPVEKILTPKRFPGGDLHAAREKMLAERRAKTHCIHGHAFDEENTVVRKDGTRHCRECQRTTSREFARRKRREARETV